MTALRQTIVCERHAGSLTLSAESCADMWRRARKAKPWDSLYPCRDCQVGAVRAGSAQSAAHVPPVSLCCRCGRSDLRLVLGQICVSCYNREREARIGRNRRGKAPIAPVRVADIGLEVGGKIMVLRAANRVELALTAARSYPGALVARVHASWSDWARDAQTPHTDAGAF